MLDSHSIKIADRIKELSYTMGTGNMVLVGAVPGFSSFGSAFSHNSNVFYAITDGTRYEVGSGVYISGVQNELKRFPLKSSNSNAVVNFPEGIKEIYSTYPATNAVYSSSGIKNYQEPKASGLAYWANNSILNYDGNLLWDDVNNRLGINNENPQYAIDIGGDGTTSLIHVSGLLVGTSGIYFPPANNGDSSYIGGRQTAHYEPNRLDDYALENELIGNLTGSSAVIELSGIANNFILFKKQNAGLVLAGPPSGCIPPCSPGYPSFRPLTLEDIPDLSSIYATNLKLASVSGILNTKIDSRYSLAINYANSVSGVLNTKIDTVSGILNNRITSVSGTILSDLTTVSGILNTKINNVSGVLNNGIVALSGTVDTNLNTLISLSGILTNYINNISGVLQQAILACCSGNIATTTTTSTTTSNTTVAPSTWSQLGSDINGEVAGDESGFRVRLNASGDILAISAPVNSGSGIDSGHVRVYAWGGSSWVQRGNDINGEAAGDYSGYSIGLNASGDILAVGAIYNSGNGGDSGHVRVYNWNGSSWIQRGNDINGENSEDRSGFSIDLNATGDVLAIGAGFNNGNGDDSGHVRVYAWNGSSWVQRGNDIDGEAADDWSGNSISLNADGDIVAIGATRNDGNGANSGHVRVYHWNASSWVQRGGDIDGENIGDSSGYSVSLNSAGDIVAIGANLNDGNGDDSGHVRVYYWDGSSWTQRGNDINGETEGDWSGTSVSLNSTGDILAIGSIFDNLNGNNSSGYVRIYNWNGNSWVQLGNTINGEAAGDLSGGSISLNSTGNVIAIGARFNDGNGTDSGHVRVYSL